MKTFKGLVNAVAKCTDVNDHNMARQLICTEYKFTKLAKAYEGCFHISDVFGYLPEGLNTVRYELDQKLKARLSACLFDGADGADLTPDGSDLTPEEKADALWMSL